MFNTLYAQQKSHAVFQFTNGFIYGKDDSLNYSGYISIEKTSLSLVRVDASNGKKSNSPLVKITKVDHNKQKDLDFVADKPVNIIKLSHCSEVLHIYTDDNSDFLFALENNHIFLIYHNNFILIRFFISSGDCFKLRSLFPNS